MKRYRPSAAPRRHTGHFSLKSMFAQPEERFYRLPELELRGRTVLTDGCRRVLNFTPERMELDMGRVVITLYGSGLQIESFSGRRLSVTGRIQRIEFTRKWGGAVDDRQIPEG